MSAELHTIIDFIRYGASRFGAAGLNIMVPAAVEQPDIIATNGIIHAVGGVLFP